MSDSPRTRINMSFVRDILVDCSNQAGTLDEVDAALVRTKEGKTEAAELNKQLLNLADQLDLASRLVRNEYWAVRGGVSYEV